MIAESTTYLPLWMMLSAGFGFLAGEAIGDYSRHRKCLEQDNESLRAELDKAHTASQPIHQQLKHQRGVLHDVHKQITAVSKALQNLLP